VDILGLILRIILAIFLSLFGRRVDPYVARLE